MERERERERGKQTEGKSEKRVKAEEDAQMESREKKVDFREEERKREGSVNRYGVVFKERAAV